MDAVMGFRAAGLDVFPVSEPAETAHTINRLAQHGYAVILITEEAASAVPDTLRRYKAEPLPAIIPIPGTNGSDGTGMAALRANVERAVGANILSGEPGQ